MEQVRILEDEQVRILELLIVLDYTAAVIGSRRLKNCTCRNWGVSLYRVDAARRQGRVSRQPPLKLKKRND